MATPKHHANVDLDELFPTRLEVIARDGGIAPHLQDGFIPIALVLSATPEQIDYMTPEWRSVVGIIRQTTRT